MRPGELSVTNISRSILAYLVRNPQAEDTVEGVVQWWLLDQTITHETNAVRQALADLTAKGLLIQEVGKDARIHYRINSARLNEASALVGTYHSSGRQLMSPMIKNRSPHLLTVELNNRDTIHLAPNETSRALKDFEISENPQIQKLTARNLIEMQVETATGSMGRQGRSEEQSQPEKTTDFKSQSSSRT